MTGKTLINFSQGSMQTRARATPLDNSEQNFKSKEEERDELIASMAPKISRKVTQKEAAANARQLREFHARWRARRAEQTLHDTLFGLYIKQELEMVEENPNSDED